MSTNSRYDEDTRNPEFIPLGHRVMFRQDGTQRWHQLYSPSQEALAWDGAEWATEAIGLTGLDGGPCFAYVEMRETGRKDRLIPGTGGFNGCHGRKIKLTFDKDTEDESTVDGWLVPNHRN